MLARSLNYIDYLTFLGFIIESEFQKYFPPYLNRIIKSPKFLNFYIEPKFVDYNKKSNFKARKEKETKQIKNKIESKQLIENLDLLDSNLQSKVNYFYQPYKCKEMKNYLIPMNFEEVEADINCCKTPQNDKKWRKVSNFLLKKETLYLREYLKYVNPDMYNELKKIGCDILEGKDHKGKLTNFLYNLNYKI